MEINYGRPAKSPASSPTPSVTPSPTPLEGPAETTDGPFRGLGRDTLRTMETSIKPEGKRILLGSRSAKEDYLPGQPRIRLSSESPSRLGEEDEVLKYLRKSHLTTKLDELMPCMKYVFVSLLVPLARETRKGISRG